MVGDETFGDLLRRFRTQAGLTQEELAERAGLSVRGISALERGINRAPYRATVQQLITALGLQEKEAEELGAHASRRRGPTAATGEPEHYRLPVPPTSIVGREREVGIVLHLLRWEGFRLITLTGTAGVGKTRLALEVARAVAAEYADGAAFVSLAAISDPSLVPSAVAAALGVRPAGTETPEQGLQRFLAERELLLVLDNLEQVLPAGLFMAALLAGSPRLKVLATSRAPLQIQGEQQLEVPPLEVPRAGQWVSADSLSHYPAVALFLQRARAVHGGFQPTDEQAGAIAEICRRLDGLPLAIELAAARIKLLPPRALLMRLDQRLHLLTDGPGDLPDRQQTMRDAIAWSYHLLEETGQRLFRRLSVFAGGWSLQAVEVVADDDGTDLLLRLDALVDSSLVTVGEQDDGEPRYRMLETIREYGAEQLAASGESDSAREAHARYFLALGESAGDGLSLPEQTSWLDHLERERDNIRAALGWAHASDETERGLRACYGLWGFWPTRHHLKEGRAWADRFLVQAHAGEKSVPQDLVAQVELMAGWLASFAGDYEPAGDHFEEALALFASLDDRLHMVDALNGLGAVAHYKGQVKRAIDLTEQALALGRRVSPGAVAGVVNNLGSMLCDQGEVARGVALIEEAVEMQRARGNKSGLTLALYNLADQSLLRGDDERSWTLLTEALTVCKESQYVRNTAYVLEGMGRVLCRWDAMEQAAVLHGSARTLREEQGYPLTSDEREEHDHVLDRAREALGAAAFEAAVDLGRKLTLEGAVAYALEQPQMRTRGYGLEGSGLGPAPP